MKTKPSSIETADGKEIVNKIYNDTSESEELRKYTLYVKSSSLQKEFVETLEISLKMMFFRKSISTWLVEMDAVTKAVIFKK